MKKLILACLAITCTILSGRAAIVCVAPTATTPGSFQITAPIIFTIATAGTVVAFDLNGWVTSDGTNDTSSLNPALAYSFNSTALSSPGVLHDNFVGSINSFGPNDGYIVITNNFSVSVGNTVTSRWPQASTRSVRRVVSTRRLRKLSPATCI